MAVVTVRPNSTDLNSGFTLGGGAGSVHAALSDDSQATYIRGAADYATQPQVCRVNFPDPSIPAGAVVKSVAVRVMSRTPSYVVGSGYGTLQAVISGIPGATFSAVVGGWFGWVTHQLGSVPVSSLPDELEVTLTQWPGYINLHDVAEIYLDVVYIPKPVAAVTAPTGTITTSLPTVAWGISGDASGGPQTAWEVKVFSAAQYGAGGFDPDTSDAMAESGIETAAVASWALDEALPDAAYRAYVRIAQTVNGALHWSDWDYEGFTVDAPDPAAPAAVAVTPQPDHARHQIDVEAGSGGAATTDMIEIERSDDDGDTWIAVRTVEGDGLVDVDAGVALAWDLEAPNGVRVLYRARAIHMADGEPATVSSWVEAVGLWESFTWWLKHPTNPDLNTPVVVHGEPGRNSQSGTTLHKVLGRSLPVPVRDKRGPDTGTIAFRVDTEAEGEALKAILDAGASLLLQGAPKNYWRDRWVEIGDHGTARFVDKAFVEPTIDTLAWTEVDRPVGDLEAWPSP